MLHQAYINSRGEAYQSDAPGNGGRKRADDGNSWTQPLRQSLIATAGFVKFSNLILKGSKDGGISTTSLQLGGKRMGEKVFLGLFLVGFQGSLENSLER